MQVFNAATQQLENVKWSVDADGEIICRFEDESFLKFPAGLTKEELQTQVDAVQASNEGQEVITQEMLAAREQSNALVNELNGVEDVPEAEE